MLIEDQNFSLIIIFFFSLNFFVSCCLSFFLFFRLVGNENIIVAYDILLIFSAIYIFSFSVCLFVEWCSARISKIDESMGVLSYICLKAAGAFGWKDEMCGPTNDFFIIFLKF